MNRYYHLFHTEAEQTEAYSGSGYTEPWLSCVSAATPVVVYNKPKPGIIMVYTYDGEYGEMTLTAKVYDGSKYIKINGETHELYYTDTNEIVMKNELFSYNGVVAPVVMGETYMGKSVFGYLINGNNLFPVSIPEESSSLYSLDMLLPTENSYSWTLVNASYEYTDNDNELIMHFDDANGNPIQNSALNPTAPTFFMLLGRGEEAAFVFVRQALPEYDDGSGGGELIY